MSYMNRHGAGWFDRPMQHLTRTTSKDAYQGTEYTLAQDGNIYWANVEQTGSVDVDTNNRIQTKTAARITLRGWVAINTQDRLLDTQWNETYIVTSVARGPDVMVCEGYRW